MDIVQTPALVLSAINYRDADRIATLFTEKEGVVSILAKGANRIKNRLHNTTSPLTLIECSYYHGKGELCIVEEASAIEHYYGLRKSYDHLTAGLNILSTIKQHLMPYEPHIKLFSAAKTFLLQLEKSHCPQLISCCFYFKLLLYEGRIQKNFTCHICKEPLNEAGYLDGEWVCSRHAKPRHILLSALELKIAKLALGAQSFKNLDISAEYAPDIEALVKKIQ